MANYPMTYQCGHEGSVNVTGAPEKRAKYLDEYRVTFAGTVCPECRVKAEIAEARANGDDATAERLIRERNRRNGRKGRKALQAKYGADTADAIASKHGFANRLQR